MSISYRGVHGFGFIMGQKNACPRIGAGLGSPGALEPPLQICMSWLTGLLLLVVRDS
jgi:hypothetical protein